LASHLPLCRQVGKYNDKKAAFTSNQSQTHRFLSLTANGQTCQNLRIFFQKSTSGNQVIDGSLPEVDIALMFARAKDAMTGQAKARGSSPFGKVLSYFQTLTRKNNLSICKGGKGIREGNWSVLHMSVHLDEGYIDTDGKPQYNPMLM
jgi:hypothetical protein